MYFITDINKTGEKWAVGDSRLCPAPVSANLVAVSESQQSTRARSSATDSRWRNARLALTAAAIVRTPFLSLCKYSTAHATRIPGAASLSSPSRSRRGGRHREGIAVVTPPSASDRERDSPRRVTSSSRTSRQPSPRHRIGSKTAQTASPRRSPANRSRTAAVVSMAWYVRPSTPYSSTDLPRRGSPETVHRRRTLPVVSIGWGHDENGHKTNYEPDMRPRSAIDRYRGLCAMSASDSAPSGTTPRSGRSV